MCDIKQKDILPIVYDDRFHSNDLLVKIIEYINKILFNNKILGCELKSISNATAPIIHATSNGYIASFADGADDMPVKKLTVAIEPVQDLHGYDNPWPEGGGKNICPLSSASSSETGYINVATGVFGTCEADKTYTISATCKITGYTTNVNVRMQVDGTWTNIANFNLPSDGGRISKTFTPTSNGDITLSASVLPANTLILDEIQLELSSTATSFAPYSNICPITGWTKANVVRTGINIWDEKWEIGDIDNITGKDKGSIYVIRSKNYIVVKPNTQYYFHIGSENGGNWKSRFYDANMNYIGTGGTLSNNAVFTTPNNACYIRFALQGVYGTTYKHDISINYPATDTDYHSYTGQAYQITFPTEAGTVYGGTLDVTNGELVVDRMSISSYNGEVLPGKWISDRDVYTEGTTPTIGAQVVYELETPIIYHLTPTEVRTLLGQNNIWADCGAVEVEYPADTKLYIDNAISG